MNLLPPQDTLARNSTGCNSSVIQYIHLLGKVSLSIRARIGCGEIRGSLLRHQIGIRPAFSSSRKSEHTHLWQIASLEISSWLRNCMAASLFRMSTNVPSRRLPNGRWKKQGRTAPSDSITADTQGALQRGASGGICPRCARKCNPMRRSFSGLSRMKPDLISSWHSPLISPSISRTSSSTSSAFNATLASALFRPRRPNG